MRSLGVRRPGALALIYAGGCRPPRIRSYICSKPRALDSRCPSINSSARLQACRASHAKLIGPSAIDDQRAWRGLSGR